MKTGDVLRDKWTLNEPLGAGGMATVFAATHRNGTRGAIKILHPEYAKADEIRSRFLREGYLANKVKHAGAVRVLDDDVTDDGTVFLVMELLTGKTLKTIWQEQGRRLPVEYVINVALRVLEVLEAAHESEIVHRDVKPDNIFQQEDGSIKLLDFGVARLREGGDDRTQTGSMLGTPAFMSPEQALAHWDRVDARSDLFSLGATMWTLLTGRLVQSARTIPELLIATATRQAPPFASTACDAPEALSKVIDRALAFEPEDRWQTAKQMRTALQRVLVPNQTIRLELTPDEQALLLAGPNFEPSSAEPTTRPTRTQKLEEPAAPSTRSNATVRLAAVATREGTSSAAPIPKETLVSAAPLVFDAPRNSDVTPVRLQEPWPVKAPSARLHAMAATVHTRPGRHLPAIAVAAALAGTIAGVAFYLSRAVQPPADTAGTGVPVMESEPRATGELVLAPPEPTSPTAEPTSSADPPVNSAVAPTPTAEASAPERPVATGAGSATTLAGPPVPVATARPRAPTPPVPSAKPTPSSGNFGDH